MVILSQKINREQLAAMAKLGFGDMVKGVADIDRGLLALDAQLHSDLEALLIRDGSQQAVLWGINLYPEIPGFDFIEYDSMINVRPSSGNRTRGVESEDIRKKIIATVAKWVEL